jgi:hypothetical protein
LLVGANYTVGGAGIGGSGGSRSGDGGTVKITGGVVDAHGKAGAAAIGGGTAVHGLAAGRGAGLTVTGGTVRTDGSLSIGGDPKHPGSLTVTGCDQLTLTNEVNSSMSFRNCTVDGTWADSKGISGRYDADGNRHTDSFAGSLDIQDPLSAVAPGMP